jgi:zinc protease
MREILKVIRKKLGNPFPSGRLEVPRGEFDARVSPPGRARSHNRASFVFVVLLALAGCGAPKGVIAPPPITREDEVASFKPLQPERWVLPNGLTVFFMKDEELPLVRGRLFMRGGSLWAPAKPVGVVGAMGDLMRLGGAGDLSADALDRELEKLAAGIGSSFGAESGGTNFACLASDFERVFKIFADVTLRPRFENEKISLWKGQALEGIRRRKDDPQTVASIAFMTLMYGDTPYGRIVDDEDVLSMNRQQFLGLHREFVRPDEAILVITGRVEKDIVAKFVETHFGSWTPRGSKLPPPPPVGADPKPGIYFIGMPFSQASVQMGQLGVARLTPDYPAIEVFNEIFGSSGFGSRLMNRVRTELGLSYGVHGGISPGVVKGVNYVFLQTKVASVVPAIEESLAVLRTLQEQHAPMSEIEEKQAAIAKSFVFNFDSVDDVAVRRAKLELLKYPLDYDETYLSKIKAVDPEKVRTVAQERWDPSKFVVVVVGDESAYSILEKATQEKESPLHRLEVKKLRFDRSLVMQ